MKKNNPTLNCPYCGNWDCPANCDKINLNVISKSLISKLK